MQRNNNNMIHLKEGLTVLKRQSSIVWFAADNNFTLSYRQFSLCSISPFCSMLAELWLVA